MKNKSIFILMILLGVCWRIVSLHAQTPNLLNYQGKLIIGGFAVSGPFSMTFSIYSSEIGGSALWTEIQTVTVAKGVFNVMLGSVTPFPSTVFSSAGDRFLGIKVGNDPEIAPRFRLTSAAFAIRAREAEGVVDGAINTADLADGIVTAPKIAAGQVVKSVNGRTDAVTLVAGTNVTLTPSGNTITIASTAAGVPSINNITGPVTISGAGGATITTRRDSIVITAGSGGTGNGIQGVQNTNNTLDITNPNGPTATINVKNNAISGLQLADNAVASAKIVDGTISNIDIAATASIAESKLALNFPTHSNTNDPTATEKAALVGTNGTPSSTNRFVTDNDVRNSNSRPPNGAAGGDLTGTYPSPAIANNAVTSAKIADGTIQQTDLAFALGTGDITDVNAGTGLTGGGTSGSVTLSVATSGITSSMIQDGAVNSNKIGSSQVVKSINSLRDNVTLAAGQNVIITPIGNTLTIAATGNSSRNTLEAADGNPRDAVFVDNDGDVGIGTTTPNSEKRQTWAPVLTIGPSGSGNAAILELQGNQTIMTGAALGAIIFKNTSATSDKRLGQIHMFPDGDINSGYLKFETSNAGSPVEGLRITKEGHVGIGTDNPSEKLFVEGNIRATGSITPGSSRDFKENIANLSLQEAVATLENLNPVKFNYKAEKEKDLHVGFIAEDMPELLATPDRKGVNPLDVIAVLTKVVQAQQMEIASLREEIKALKDQN